MTHSKKFKINDGQGISEAVGFISQLPDGKWQVTVEKQKRSLSQNALYWKWVHEIADLVSEHTGYNQDEVHQLFKAMFLPASGRSTVIHGNTCTEVLTTTKLNTKEMHEYMNRIYEFAWMEFEINLPIPEWRGHEQ